MQLNTQSSIVSTVEPGSLADQRGRRNGAVEMTVLNKSPDVWLERTSMSRISAPTEVVIVVCPLQRRSRTVLETLKPTVPSFALLCVDECLFTKVNWDKTLVSGWLVQQICGGYLSVFPDWGYGCLRLLHHMIKLLP